MRVLIVDDNDKMRAVIRGAVAAIPGEVYEGANGSEAVSLHEQLEPDWLVIDIAMPILDGLEATRRILQASPGARIVILTVYDDRALRDEARAAGACAYLLKENLHELRHILTNRAGAEFPQ